MLCKRVPENKEKYYATDDARIIHYLIEHDIYPLYSDGANVGKDLDIPKQGNGCETNRCR